MAGLHRSPVTAIPWENQKGATVLCDDGSLWELQFTDSSPTWTDLKAPLPGSTAAYGWTPERPRTDSPGARIAENSTSGTL